jgi:hypothetical protein
MYYSEVHKCMLKYKIKWKDIKPLRGAVLGKMRRGRKTESDTEEKALQCYLHYYYL